MEVQSIFIYPHIYVAIKRGFEMKLTWKGSWKKGDIVLEAESAEELISTLEKLEVIEKVIPRTMSINDVQDGSDSIPKISSSVGPSQAVREVLGSAWGKTESRTMKEINAILETNAIYFSASSLSGVLTNMTKKGELRRSKKDDQWAYALSAET